MTQDLVSIFDDFFNNNNRFVGFRDLFDMSDFKLNQKMMTFPPYNIYKREVKSDSNGNASYETTIELALAGYSKDDVNASFNEKTHMLVVETTDAYSKKERTKVEYDYKGISERAFKLSWKLNPNLELCRCGWEDGICSITFKDKTDDYEDAVKQIKFE